MSNSLTAKSDQQDKSVFSNTSTSERGRHEQFTNNKEWTTR